MDKMREILKKLMELNGDDAYSLQERSGVPQPTTQRYLSGKHGDPRTSTVTKWAKAYGIKDSQLRGYEPIPQLEEHIDVVEVSNVVVHNFGKNKDRSNYPIKINQFHEVGGSMGVGVLLQDQPGQITSWEVTQEWVLKNFPANTGIKNLCIITGFGDSMRGMYNPGDPLIVDTGIKTCDHDGPYFFRVGNEGFVKRLQRIPGQGIRVISENPNYETWTITEGMDFQVLGKVLKSWKSTEF